MEMDAKRRYEDAKADYHMAGRELKREKSPENKARYEYAKEMYHELGKRLRDENRKQ